MALFGLISSDEELSADRARLAASKDFATRSIEDASKYNMSDSQRLNPQTGKPYDPINKKAISTQQEIQNLKSVPNPNIAQKTSFDIQNFRTEINENSILPTNRFLVVMPRPLIFANDPMTNQYFDLRNEFLTLRCENVVLPGMSFNNMDIFRYGYGVREQRPYGVKFDSIALTFVVDRETKVIDYFNKWTNHIINYDVSKGMAPAGGNMPFELTYKDDYICKQMQIYVYDYNNNRKTKVTLFDAYPESTNPINLDSGNGDMMKFTTTIKYTYLTIETSADDTATKGK